jgi:hypothetical protein
MCFKENDFQGYFDGVAATPDTSGSMPSGIDNFNVGSLTNESLHWNGHIAEIRYYNERLDNETLENMSNGIFPVSGHSGIGLGFGKVGAQGAQ